MIGNIAAFVIYNSKVSFDTKFLYFPCYFSGHNNGNFTAAGNRPANYRLTYSGTTIRILKSFLNCFMTQNYKKYFDSKEKTSKTISKIVQLGMKFHDVDIFRDVVTVTLHGCIVFYSPTSQNSCVPPFFELVFVNIFS